MELSVVSDKMLTDQKQTEPSSEEPIEEVPMSPILLPSSGPELPMRRSTRTRKFPRGWRDYETTSYTPLPMMPQVNEELFEQRIEPPPVIQEPTALLTPDISKPSPHHSPPNRFHICRVFTASPTINSSQNEPSPDTRIHFPHPFKNDSIFEMVKACCLGPSSKTIQGMDAITKLISSGKVTADELSEFKAVTELRRLDDFAAQSHIAGGPWQTGSVKIKMPCIRSNKPSFSVESDAPEFEVHGVRYRSLVDIIVSKLQDPSMSASFVRTPFTEWWCPPGSTTPIRVYGEAYSSDIAVKLFEEIKGIPPPADHPQIESVVMMLMLGSDATHLANFGTASLWPIYVFFGNISKYDSSRPSEFPACHLAYLPKVG
jgi:Plavaka transposase